MCNREAAGDSLLDRATVNLFRGSTDTRPVKVLSLAQVLDAIQDGRYQRPIQWLRDLLQAGDKAGYDQGKRRLDAVTFGGTFDPTRAKAHLIRHSGIVLGDCDHLKDLRAAKTQLRVDRYVVFLFESPSAEGLKLGVHIDPVADDTAYKRAWQAAADYYAQHYSLS